MKLSQGSLQLSLHMPLLFCLPQHLLVVRNARVVIKPNSVVKQLSPEIHHVGIYDIFQTFSTVVSNIVSFILI